MPILPFHILKSNDIWIDNVIDLESDFCSQEHDLSNLHI